MYGQNQPIGNVSLNCAILHRAKIEWKNAASIRYYINNFNDFLIWFWRRFRCVSLLLLASISCAFSRFLRETSIYLLSAHSFSRLWILYSFFFFFSLSSLTCLRSPKKNMLDVWTQAKEIPLSCVRNSEARTIFFSLSKAQRENRTRTTTTATKQQNRAKKKS